MRTSHLRCARVLKGLALGTVILTACFNTTAEPDPFEPISVSTTTSMPTPTTSTPTTTTSTSVLTTTSLSPTTTATSTVPTTTGAPLIGITVAIDPGHNGRNAEHADEIGRLVDIGNGTKPCNTTGTAAPAGYPEAAFTWDVAVTLRSLLSDLGADVIMTRRDNDGWGPCITERAAIGNRADLAVSIHADGASADERGFHVIYPAAIVGLTDDIAGSSRRLAEILVTEMSSRLEIPASTYIGEAGLDERSDLGGLNLSDVPVVFLEAGNMKNVDDMAVLGDPTGRAAIAHAIAEAIVAFTE